jgi:hypothetical protein
MKKSKANKSVPRSAQSPQPSSNAVLKGKRIPALAPPIPMPSGASLNSKKSKTKTLRFKKQTQPHGGKQTVFGSQQ